MISIVSVGFRGSNDSKCGLLDETRIARRKSIAQGGENFFDFGKVFARNVSTAIGGGSHSCALYVGGEERKEIKQGPKTTLADDCRGILCGKFFQSLQWNQHWANIAF